MAIAKSLLRHVIFWLCASIPIMMTLKGCGDSLCQERERTRCDGRCYWNNCAGACDDSYGDTVENYCSCTFKSDSDPAAPIPEFCSNLSTTAEMASMGLSSTPCPAPGRGCVCSECSAVFAAGRLYTSESGSLSARIVNLPSISEGSVASSGECDWSSWPATGLSDKVLQITQTEGELDADISLHYQGVGLAEHASVASFSRAALELMEHGATAELLDRTLAAAREEVQHARMALALARAWSGSPFRLTGIAGHPAEHRGTGLADFARRTATEACAGETPAVLRASVAYRFAQDERVREYLTAVMVEERRHAELAWTTVAWALLVDAQANHDPEAGGAVWQAVTEALTSAASSLHRKTLFLAHANPEANNFAGLLRAGILTPNLEAKVAQIAQHLVECLQFKLLQDRLITDGIVQFESLVHQHFEDALEAARAVSVEAPLVESDVVRMRASLMRVCVCV